MAKESGVCTCGNILNRMLHSEARAKYGAINDESEFDGECNGDDDVYVCFSCKTIYNIALIEVSGNDIEIEEF